MFFEILTVFLLVTKVARVETALQTNESNLIRYLLQGYNKNVLPRVDGNKNPVNVKLLIWLRRIVAFDEREQAIKMDIWVQQTWKNELLTWDPAKFEQIRIVNIERGLLWTPDTLLINSINDTVQLFTDNRTHIRATSEGEHQIYIPLMVYASCTVDISAFPFDEQECTIEFSTWTNNNHRVNMFTTMKFSWYHYINSSSWILLSGEMKNKSTFYKCCARPFTSVLTVIKIRRVSIFYGVVLFFPITASWIPILLGFIAPTLSGERITFSISVLLTLVFFAEVANKSLPRSSNHIPMYGKYYFGVVMVIVLSMFITAIATKIFYVHDYHLEKEFNKFQSILLQFGSYFPYIGSKCQRLLDLKHDFMHNIGVTCKVKKDLKNYKKDTLNQKVEDVFDKVYSLDEGFGEDTEYTNQQQQEQQQELQESGFRQRGKTANKNALLVTEYRRKIQKLRQICTYLWNISSTLQKDETKVEEDFRQACYANAIVDLIDRLALATSTTVLISWFCVTVAKNIH